MISTPFTEMFGVEHPIVQGGMQRVGGAELVAAVANAGALGFITALTQPTPEALPEEIAMPRADRQAVRRQPDDPAVDQPASLRRVREAVIESGIKIVETAGLQPASRIWRCFKPAGSR